VNRMSNREAIALLRNLEDALDSYCELNEEGKTAFRMAIEALNSSEIPNSSDTIYRQDAIDAVEEERFPVDSDYAEGFMAALDKFEWILKKWLPSADVQPVVRCKDCQWRADIKDVDTGAIYHT